MAGEREFLIDLSVALALALAGGWLAGRLGLSSILGYIAAGAIISPFTPGFEGDIDRLRVLADIGVVLLLFAIGLQYSLDDLLEEGWGVAVAATAQTAIVLVGGTALLQLTGLSLEEAAYLAAAAAISSSVVLVKLLDAAPASFGWVRTALAWSIAQDLLAVVLVVTLQSLANDTSGGEAALDLLWSAAKGTAFVAAMLFVGVRVVPAVLDQVATQRSRELFFVAVAVLVMGTALFSEYAGLSLAFGAFLAGIVVSESDLSHQVLGDLLPVKDIFAVIFFVAAGMLIDPSVLQDEWHIVIALIALIAIAKPLIIFSGLRIAGAATSASLLAGAMLTPGAEFSFVLAAEGLDEGVLSEDLFSALLMAAVVSIVMAPPYVAGARWLLDRGSVTRIAHEPVAEPEPSRLGRHAVVCGYGRAGQIAASVLQARFSVIVGEDDRRRAKAARAEGFEVVEGTLTSGPVIELLRLAEARLLIITLGDPFAARLLSERASEINPHLEILGQATAPAEAQRLERAGMATAIVAEDEIGLELARMGLHRFGVSAPEALRIVQRARARLR